MKYEMLYIIDKDLTDEAKEVVVDKVKKIIESKNGNILTLDKWGMKKFAYPINYKNEGYYVLVNFEIFFVFQLVLLAGSQESGVEHMAHETREKALKK